MLKLKFKYLNKLMFIFSTIYLLINCKLANCQSPYLIANKDIPNQQSNPVVVANQNKEFIIFYKSCASTSTISNPICDIYGRKFNKNGSEIKPQTKIPTSNENPRDSPDATLLTDGKIIVVWHAAVNSSNKIRGRIIDFDFLGNDEFYINSPSNDNNLINPSVFKLSQARFIVFYQYKNDNNEYDIYSTIYNSSQTKLKDYFKLNDRKTSSSGDKPPSCAEFSDGSFVVTYSSYNTDLSSQEVYAKVFNPDYSPKTLEFIINTIVTLSQSRSSISIGPNNEVLIVYQSETTSNLFDIYYKVYNMDFTKSIKSETTLNTYTKGDQSRAVIKRIDDTKNLICWKGQVTDTDTIDDISCRIVDFQGNAYCQDFPIIKEHSKQKADISLENFNSQQIIVAFVIDTYTGGNGLDVYFEMNYLYQRVNDSIDKEQTKPLIVSLSDGGFIIFWLCEKCSANGVNNILKFKIYNRLGLLSFKESDLVTISTIDTNDFSAITL